VRQTAAAPFNARANSQRAIYGTPSTVPKAQVPKTAGHGAAQSSAAVTRRSDNLKKIIYL